MKSKEQIENERLVAEHNRHRRRLGYSFMRAPWSGTDYLYPLYLGHVITIEGDNRKLAAMNKVYEESTSPAEANEREMRKSSKLIGMKNNEKESRMCDCCHKKKAVTKNPNGQWCCKGCDIVATMANNVLGDLLTTKK